MDKKRERQIDKYKRRIAKLLWKGRMAVNCGYKGVSERSLIVTGSDKRVSGASSLYSTRCDL